MRILCIGETWLGSDARSAFSALRRLGHAIHVIDESHFVPTEWSRTPARILRKLFRGVMVDELTHRVIDSLGVLRPDALFVFKGNYVAPDILDAARRLGTLSINYYPDVSFLAHGPQLPKALPLYDHVFNAKTFGVEDMRAYGVPSVGFLPPGFDPEIHRPMALTESDHETFSCDVSFIGTWSPKKEKILAGLRSRSPDISLRIWGNQWFKSKTRALDSSVMGTGITGDDYSRAITASRISLGLLSEARAGASSGDLITARTFQIPACRAFMLHERTVEVAEYFMEGRDAEFFDSPDELANKVQRYLRDDAARDSVARNGYKRSVEEPYSIDARVSVVVDWIASRTKGGRSS